jgi:hypothetical protein
MEANATLNLNDEARARLRAAYKYLVSLSSEEKGTADRESPGCDIRQAANDTPPEEAEAGGPPCPGANRPH